MGLSSPLPARLVLRAQVWSTLQPGEVFKSALQIVGYKRCNLSQRVFKSLKLLTPQVLYLEHSLSCWTKIWWKGKLCTTATQPNQAKDTAKVSQWFSQLMLKLAHIKHSKCQLFMYILTLLSKRERIWNHSKIIFLFLTTASLNIAKLRFSKSCFVFCLCSRNCQAHYCSIPSIRLDLFWTAASVITLCRGHFITDLKQSRYSGI